MPTALNQRVANAPNNSIVNGFDRFDVTQIQNTFIKTFDRALGSSQVVFVGEVAAVFVDGLPEGEQDAQIARAIIAMAHSLNLTVIAEGVETLAQLDFLRGHDCDEVQGFLLGRPMPAQQFTALFTGTALFMLG